MTDLRAQLDRLGVTQSGVARLIGVNSRTVRGWVSEPSAAGHRDIPPPVARLLDILEHVPGAMERLAVAARGDRG